MIPPKIWVFLAAANLLWRFVEMWNLIYFLSKSACGSAKAIYTFDAMFVRAKIVLAKLSINSDSIAPFGSEEKELLLGTEIFVRARQSIKP